MTMYIKIKKEIIKVLKGKKGRNVDIFMHPRVAVLFDEGNTARLSKAIKRKIRIRPDYKLHHEEFEIKES